MQLIFLESVQPMHKRRGEKATSSSSFFLFDEPKRAKPRVDTGLLHHHRAFTKASLSQCGKHRAATGQCRRLQSSANIFVLGFSLDLLLHYRRPPPPWSSSASPTATADFISDFPHLLWQATASAGPQQNPLGPPRKPPLGRDPPLTTSTTLSPPPRHSSPTSIGVTLTVIGPYTLSFLRSNPLPKAASAAASLDGVLVISTSSSSSSSTTSSAAKFLNHGAPPLQLSSVDPDLTRSRHRLCAGHGDIHRCCRLCKTLDRLRVR